MSRCPFCGGDPEAPVRARWELFVPVEPPSQNEIASANRGNYAQRRAYRRFRDGYMLVLQAWRTRERIPLPGGRRRVIFSRYYTGRGQRRDKGNLIGGMKSLLDAMVAARLLLDDTEAAVEDHYRQDRVDGESGVSIILEDL